MYLFQCTRVQAASERKIPQATGLKGSDSAMKNLSWSVVTEYSKNPFFCFVV
jgi:hypothetical protein